MYLVNNFDIGRELLKIIAVVTMTIDHLGAVFFPDQPFFRVVGRLSFPLFCYLIVVGVESTRNVKWYFLRLFFFAIVSQIPYCLTFGFEPLESLNIFFTLALGVLFLMSFKVNVFFMLLPLVASYLLHVDYSVYGILLIGCMSVLKREWKLGVLLTIVLNLIYFDSGFLQMVSTLSLPLIGLHHSGIFRSKELTNGHLHYSSGRKYFFYIYYPLHLSLLHLFQTLIA